MLRVYKNNVLIGYGVEPADREKNEKSKKSTAKSRITGPTRINFVQFATDDPINDAIRPPPRGNQIRKGQMNWP